MKQYIQINKKKDNVAVALQELKCNDTITLNDTHIIIHDNIPPGHKFALKTIHAGEAVIKYGFPIGKASAEITAGAHVHSHNLASVLAEQGEYNYSKAFETPLRKLSNLPKSFLAYVRANGNIGIRNEIWIVPTVGCVNDIAVALANAAKAATAHISNIDDIIAFRHPYGCSQLGDDQENTRKILADLCMHPNAGGVLLLGLGCENSGISEIKKYINRDPEEIKYMICQEVDDEIETGINMITELATHAASVKRTDVDISELTIGIKCGGSDGFSGITANPLVGFFSDRLINAGGSVLMSEVPEMFGAEDMFLNRCSDIETFERSVKMIQDFKDYFASHKQPVYENPSPGNKAGGITTLEEKSLGCVQKAGNSEIKDVLNYADMRRAKGLSLISAPGNDLVSSTALAAAGAHLILFTTGRGTPFSSPVPTLKISSNNHLYETKKNWIDFNAGTLTDDADFDKLADELFMLVIDTVNGKKLKSEIAGYRDMAIFKQNITL